MSNSIRPKFPTVDILRSSSSQNLVGFLSSGRIVKQDPTKK